MTKQRKSQSLTLVYVNFLFPFPNAKRIGVSLPVVFKLNFSVIKVICNVINVFSILFLRVESKLPEKVKQYLKKIKKD